MTLSFDALVEFGLTANEAKTYLAMLRLGSASVNEIARQAGVHRVNAYDIIQRLAERGLVSSAVKGSKAAYEAVAPDKLVALLDERRQLIEKALPEMRREFDMRSSKQEIFVFTGPDGVFNAYKLMLAQQQTIYGIGGQGLNRKYLKHRHEQFEAERKRQKTMIRALYYESSRTVEIGDKSREIRYLPDELKSPVMVDFCGDLVVILLAATNISAIVIQSRDLADSYRKQFEFMWRFAKA
jgi:HTH-type transcriptional regulator, sugar sensing transcriptional regulator